MLNLPRRQAGLVQHLLKGSSNHNSLYYSTDPEIEDSRTPKKTIKIVSKQVQHLLKGSSNHNSLFYSADPEIEDSRTPKKTIKIVNKKVQGDGSGRLGSTFLKKPFSKNPENKNS